MHFISFSDYQSTLIGIITSHKFKDFPSFEIYKKDKAIKVQIHSRSEKISKGNFKALYNYNVFLFQMLNAFSDK